MRRDSGAPLVDLLKRRVLMTIFVLSWVGTVLAWTQMESRGVSSAVLRIVFGLNVLFHPVMGAIVWKRLLPLRVVDLSCLIEHELLRYSRYGHTFSIVVFGVDHFKTVNDRFGHRVGDETLVALAARTSDVLREVDRLGRWGGDEFIVVLPETGFEETLHKCATRRAGSRCPP